MLTCYRYTIGAINYSIVRKVGTATGFEPATYGSEIDNDDLAAPKRQVDESRVLRCSTGLSYTVHNSTLGKLVPKGCFD